MKILDKTPTTTAGLLRRRISYALGAALVPWRINNRTVYNLNRDVARDLDEFVELIARTAEHPLVVSEALPTFTGPKEPCIPV